MRTPIALLFITLAVVLDSIESSSQGREGSEGHGRRQGHRSRQDSARNRRPALPAAPADDPPPLQFILDLWIPDGVDIRNGGEIIGKYHDGEIIPYLHWLHIAIFRQPPAGETMYEMNYVEVHEWVFKIGQWARAISQYANLSERWVQSICNSATNTIVAYHAELAEARRGASDLREQIPLHHLSSLRRFGYSANPNPKPYELPSLGFHHDEYEQGNIAGIQFTHDHQQLNPYLPHRTGFHVNENERQNSPRIRRVARRTIQTREAQGSSSSNVHEPNSTPGSFRRFLKNWRSRGTS